MMNTTMYWTIQTKSKWQEVQMLGYLMGNSAYVYPALTGSKTPTSRLEKNR